jgi:hypothetical protein
MRGARVLRAPLSTHLRPLGGPASYALGQGVSMSARSCLAARAARITRDDDAPDRLPHWSDTAPRRRAPEDAPARVPPPTHVAAILVDLVAWAADLGIALTQEAPEERAAIEGVRDYAYAWLTGAPRDEVSITDVLTTAATLLSAIELGAVRRGLSGRNDDVTRSAPHASRSLVAL